MSLGAAKIETLCDLPAAGNYVTLHTKQSTVHVCHYMKCTRVLSRLAADMTCIQRSMMIEEPQDTRKVSL